MANVSQKLAQVYLGDSTIACAFYSSGTTAMISGYVQPDPESYSIGPYEEHREIIGASGAVTSTRSIRRGIECTITFRPEGNSTANAKISATMPSTGYTAAISGMPVIQVGQYADAWNVAQGSNEMWQVVSVGAMSGSGQDPQTFSVTMRRYYGLTGNTVIS